MKESISNDQELIQSEPKSCAGKQNEKELNLQMNLVMRRPDFCICENKCADQLCDNRTADQRLCFRYSDTTIPLLSKPLTIFCSCTAWFVSDQVGNPEDRVSHNEAQIESLQRDRVNSSFFKGLRLLLSYLDRNKYYLNTLKEEIVERTPIEARYWNGC